MRLLPLLVIVVSATVTSGQTKDHLTCYRLARDPQTHATYTADLDALVPQPGCRILVPAKMACVPTTKSNVQPTPPGTGGTGTPNSFYCYKVKCPHVVLPTITGEDQFGSRIVTPGSARLLCAPLAAPLTGCLMPATGQTTCWDSSGTVIPCSGTGQDGDVRAGAPLAYIDNGDGTVTDANTGLMWEKNSQNDGSIHDTGNNARTWDEAFSVHVAGLNTMGFAGHSDWRLPNVRELASILNYENASPPTVSPAFNNNCTSPCTVLTCSCTSATDYWSSTTHALVPQNAFTVHFGDAGVVGNGIKTTSALVRAVRGSP